MLKRFTAAFAALTLLLIGGCDYLNDPFPTQPAAPPVVTQAVGGASPEQSDAAPDEYPVMEFNSFPFDSYTWGEEFTFDGSAQFSLAQADGAYIYELRTRDPELDFGIAFDDGDYQLSMRYAYATEIIDGVTWYTQSFAYPSEKEMVNYYVKTTMAKGSAPICKIRITQLLDDMIQPIPQIFNGSGARLLGVYLLSDIAAINITSDDTAKAPVQLVLISAEDMAASSALASPRVSVLFDGYDSDGALLPMLDQPIELECSTHFALYIAASSDCKWQVAIDMLPQEGEIIAVG